MDPISKKALGLVVHNDLIATCLNNKTVKIWSTVSFDLLCTLHQEEVINSVAESAKNVGTVCDDGNLHVYRNINGCTFDFAFALHVSDDVLNTERQRRRLQRRGDCAI